MAPKVRFSGNIPPVTNTRGRSKATPLVLTLAVTSAPVYAIQLEDVGDTDLQKLTGAYIDTICPQMAGMVEDLNDDELRLLNRCGGAKFDQQREGFGEGDSPGVLQRLSPEETLSISSGRTDTALKEDLDTRFQALRAGVAGLSLNAVNWHNETATGGTAGVDDGKRWGFFVNGVYATGDKDDTDTEDEIEFDTYGFTTGIDYRISNNFVIGAAYSYVDADADIDDREGAVNSSTNGAGTGNTDTETNTIAVYGTWYTDNWYMDGVLSYGDSDIDGDRSIQYGNVSQIAEMDTEADQIAASFGGGYNQHIDGPWNARYFARLDYVDGEIDGYQEKAKQNSAAGSDPSNPSTDLDSLIMSIDDQDIESFQSVLGANVTYVSSRDWGVLTPYLTAQWHHEFEDDGQTITAKYVFDPTNDVLRFASDDPDEDYFRISAGVNSVLAGGTQLFFNYDTVAGLDDVTQHVFTAGVRVEF